jgi:hypothetical protein
MKHAASMWEMKTYKILVAESQARRLLGEPRLDKTYNLALLA